MNSEVKKKLEEMAVIYSTPPFGQKYTPAFRVGKQSGFMAGAQAAWELFSAPSKDDEWAADYYTETFFQATKKDQPCYADKITKAFLAGRRGLREAVEKAVREERERIIKEASKLTCYGAKIVVTELAQILNPKENA